MSYKKFERPIRTEIFITVGYDIHSEISMLGETEKAYLICYNKPLKRGWGRSTYNEITEWVPKSIWDNEKNFVNNHYGERYFNRPIWLK